MFRARAIRLVSPRPPISSEETPRPTFGSTSTVAAATRTGSAIGAATTDTSPAPAKEAAPADAAEALATPPVLFFFPRAISQMHTVPTTPAATITGINQPGVRSTHTSKSTLEPSPTHSIADAIHLAFVGITAPPPMYRKYGPNNGTRIKRSSSHGHEREKQYEAMIRKIVVGKPGVTTPSAPKPTHSTPVPASA